MTEDKAKSTTISLEQMATRYLDALQKVHDLVCFTLAGARKISEQDYDEFSQQLQIMPRQQSRMAFEKAKEATQQWLLRNSLGDSLALVVPLMEDCRTICELCQLKAAKKTGKAALNKVRGKSRTDFLQLPPEEKFTHLKENYDIGCEVDEHILALLSLTKCLMMNNGVVSTEAADDKGELRVKIRSVQLVQGAGTAEDMAKGKLTLSRKVGDSELVFKENEQIGFSKAEHIGALLTVGVFVTNMLQGLQAYAKKTGAASEEAAS